MESRQMAKGTIDIKINIDPVVSLVCMDVSCRFNLSGSCNLKNIEIGKDGLCVQREEMERKNKGE